MKMDLNKDREEQNWWQESIPKKQQIVQSNDLKSAKFQMSDFLYVYQTQLTKYNYRETNND